LGIVTTSPSTKVIFSKLLPLLFKISFNCKPIFTVGLLNSSINWVDVSLAFLSLFTLSAASSLKLLVLIRVMLAPLLSACGVKPPARFKISLTLSSLVVKT
jgi:hypothetical protein